jgi:histone H3/H4
MKVKGTVRTCPICDKKVKGSYMSIHIRNVHKISEPTVMSPQEGPYRNLRKRNIQVPNQEEMSTELDEEGVELHDEGLEAVLVDCAIHAKRKTIMPKDFELAYRIRGNRAKTCTIKAVANPDPM